MAVEKLELPVEDESNEFDDSFVDDIFNSDSELEVEKKIISGESTENKTDESPVIEPAKKRRGRPPKAKIESVSEGAVKTQPSKSVKDLDDLSLDVYNTIYNNFSIKPISELSEELNLKPKQILRVVERMDEIFNLELAGGGLSKEDYDSKIKPHLTEYVEPPKKELLKVFVENKIEEI